MNEEQLIRESTTEVIAAFQLFGAHLRLHINQRAGHEPLEDVVARVCRDILTSLDKTWPLPTVEAPSSNAT